MDREQATSDRACAGCGYDGPAGHCHLCHTEVPGADLVAHLEGVHGWTLPRWPDGGLVVVDTTLEVGDFDGP